MNVIYDSRFNSAETEIELIVREMRAGKSDRVRIAARRRFFNLRSSGIAESDNSCNLVKTFSRRVVSRFAYDRKGGAISHIDYMRVAARYHKSGERWGQSGVGKIICGDMTSQMMNGNERLSRGESEAFSEIHTNQKRAYKPGSVCDRDSVYVFYTSDRFECFPDKRRYRFDVTS